MITSAGIDPSPAHCYLSVTDRNGRIQAWPKANDFTVAEVCKQVDVVVVETPEVGHGWRPEAVRNLMPTIHHAGEIAGMLKQTMSSTQTVLEVSPEMIREVTCGWEKRLRTNADKHIEAWLRRQHLAPEQGLDYESIQACFQKGKGPLSTADKRDAYLAAWFGIMVLKDKYLQLKCFGQYL